MSLNRNGHFKPDKLQHRKNQKEAKDVYPQDSNVKKTRNPPHDCDGNFTLQLQSKSGNTPSKNKSKEAAYLLGLRGIKDCRHLTAPILHPQRKKVGGK